jgi:hypothetical protein
VSMRTQYSLLKQSQLAELPTPWNTIIRHVYPPPILTTHLPEIKIAN